MSLLSGDRELLKQFRLGEQDAMATVYREYAPAIAAFLARGFTFSSKGRKLQFNGYHQPFDLENAVQETFLRAFAERARLAYDGLSPYRSYIMAIARNLVLTELRRREVAMSQLVKEADDGREGSVADAMDGLAAEPLNAGAPEPTGEAEFLRQELTHLYQSFVEELKPQHADFFRARFEDRLTQVEAGQRANLSHMQARTLEKKLRKRFLKFMQSRGYLEGYRKDQPALASLCLMMML